MTITYPLTAPSHAFARTKLRAITQVATSRSPFSLQTQVQDFGAQLWALEVTLSPMTRDEFEEWVCFLLMLNGPKGTFLVGDSLARDPQGVATGTPLVNGGSQTGNSLITDGWTGNTTNILKAGDYLQIGNRLYKNLQDVNSDSGGNATLDIFPRLRESPANNAGITLSNTIGTFRLPEIDYELYTSDPFKIGGLSFTALEAI